MSSKSHKWMCIQLVILIQVWTCWLPTNSEFCDSYQSIQKVACAEEEGCVYAVKTNATWVQGQMICDCHEMQFADIPVKMQNAINEAPKNLRTDHWISGSKVDVLPCGFVKGLTKAEEIVCQSFESGVFLWLVQAFFTQRHRGDTLAIPICRREGCDPIDVRHCIHFGNRTSNWYDARNQCLNQGGDLFYLTHQDNDNFLMFMLTFINIIVSIPAIGDPIYWSGIRYEDWYWQGAGDVLQTNWALNEPDTNQTHKCIAMDMTTGEWKSMPCGTTLSALCRDPDEIYVPPSRPSTTKTSTASTTSTTTRSTPQSPTTNQKTIEQTTMAERTKEETTAQITTAEQKAPITAMTTEAADTTTVVMVTTTEEDEEIPNATSVSLSFCLQNKVVCGAVPAVVLIVVLAIIIIAVVVVCVRRRRQPKEKPIVKYAIELPHTVEQDNPFGNLSDGDRAENIYVDAMKGELREDEGIYDEIGKKPGFDDDDYDETGSIKKPPFDDDDDDFDSLKKPKANYGFEFEEDLKKY